MNDTSKSLVCRPAWRTPTSRPVVKPLQPSVVYASPDFGALNVQYDEGFSFTYSRKDHPNASVLAQEIDSLEGTLGVISVLHPRRLDHPNLNRTAHVYGIHFENMKSFKVKSEGKAANMLTNAVPDLPFKPIMGDVGTTLSQRTSSSICDLTKEGRGTLGISEGFFLISVSLENAELHTSKLTEVIVASYKV